MEIGLFRRIPIMTALAALALASSTACAEQSETVRITVEARKGFQFQPAKFSVPAGSEVVLTLKNNAVMGHNLHIPKLEVMTETITKGESDTVRFTTTEPGTYAIRCEVTGHAEAGMTGKLKVR